MKKAKLTINKKAVNGINANMVRALEQTADATLTDIIQAQVIPFDAGTMQDDQTFVDSSESASGKAYIVTSAVQAERLYMHPEYDFQTVNNPNAKGNWFEDWLDGKFSRAAYAKILLKLNGGKR